MQRLSDKIDPFGRCSQAETTPIRDFGAHAFNIFIVLRVFILRHNYKEWLVETVWFELPTPHAVIEPVSDTQSQERKFSMQRPVAEMASFAAIAGAETAPTREFGRHAFDITELLRVSIGRTGLEPGTR